MTIIFYTTISLFKYVCVFICGGHHDSDRIAVLVMPVSKAENIVLYIILYMYTCQNKDFLPPFLPPFLPSPQLVVSGLCLLATELLAIGVRQVGLCQIRNQWRNCGIEEGAKRVAAVNAMLEAECQGSSSQFYWRHKSLWTSLVHKFRLDQVHYFDVGNLSLYRSIRGGDT